MRSASAIALAAASLTAALLTAGPASATATDTTPPALKVLPYAQLSQGKSLGAQYYLSDGTSTVDVPMHFSWKATDASGICGYDLFEDDIGDGVIPVFQNSTRTSYSAMNSDYRDQEGGGGYLADWRVRAHDCAGNTTTKQVNAIPSVTQENGANPGDYPIATITYAGSWSVSHCTCYDDGADEKTSAAGATASLSISANRYASMGLVMETASTRGKFTLTVDGVNRGTIDTYSATARHMVLVWVGQASFSGSHVITLANQATAGRPRIDLDSFVVMD